MTGSDRPRVVVCGLGPAGADLVTGATHAAVARIAHRFLRTRHHPSAPVVGEATTFDALYESAASMGEVYAGIVEGLVTAAGRHGEVLYAVPGSPAVAERTVELLRADPRVVVEVLPALSFADLAWVVLGVDPVAAGARLVDGHRFESEAAGSRGPLLVGQCDHRDVLSEVKLALGEVVDREPLRPAAGPDGPGPAATAAGTPAAGGGTDGAGAAGAGDGVGDGGASDDGGDDGAGSGELTVTVLQRLGLPGQSVRTMPWHELDRVVEPDHLTSVYVPRLAAPVAGEVAHFAAVVRRLRAECPWDREQTHHSLRRHLLEEAYEVLEAIDHVDVEAGTGFDHLEEELGDLLFQVVFHATLAAEEGHFTLADVARGIATKLVGRHPHVFGDTRAETADEVAANWEQLKRAEKGRASVMDGIPAVLPALLYALKVQKRAEAEGVDWRSLSGRDEGDLGRRLLDLVDEARRGGLDPESELRLAAEEARDRFRAREAGPGVP